MNEEKKEVPNPFKECFLHAVENKVHGKIYYHEQICLQCLDKKVEIMWDYIQKQVAPNIYDEGLND